MFKTQKIGTPQVWSLPNEEELLLLLFLNGPTPASYIVYFQSFHTNLQQIYVKNVHPEYSTGI